MKRGLTAFLLLHISAPASAMTDLQIVAAATEQVEKAAARWGVSTSFVADDTDRIRSLPAGQVKASAKALRSALSGVPESEFEALLAWLMAHEVWHQLQFRRGFDPANADENAKRLNECEADVMAAFAVVDERLQSRSVAPVEEAAQELVAQLQRTMNVVQQLEAGYDGQLTHPSPRDRVLAIRTGAARAVHGRIYTLSSDPLRSVVRDRLAKLHDIRLTEPADAWARRVCRLILHLGNGVSNLALDQPAIRWNSSGDPPVVDYALRYRNTGSETLKVTMQVRSASVPRQAPDDIARWSFADAQTHQFEMRPGASHTVSSRLDWYATDELKPRLLFPMEAGSIFDVQAVPAGQTSDVAPLSLTPELAKLKSDLQSIYTAARFRFQPVAANCESVGGGQICELKTPLPGVVSRSVHREPDGASEVYAVFYRGQSKSDAEGAYAEFRRKLRIIYPAVSFNERVRPDGGQEVNFQPAQQALVRLLHGVRDGEHVVSMTVTPQLY